MRLIFKTYGDFEKWFKQSPSIVRKLNKAIYTVCKTPRGFELIPVISTRHLHSIVVETPDDGDYVKMLKTIDRLLGIKEEEIPFCIAEPV
jgi:hypothetical protein